MIFPLLLIQERKFLSWLDVWVPAVSINAQLCLLTIRKGCCWQAESGQMESQKVGKYPCSQSCGWTIASTPGSTTDPLNLWSCEIINIFIGYASGFRAPFGSWKLPRTPKSFFCLSVLWICIYHIRNWDRDKVYIFLGKVKLIWCSYKHHGFMKT